MAERERVRVAAGTSSHSAAWSPCVCHGCYLVLVSVSVSMAAQLVGSVLGVEHECAVHSILFLVTSQKKLKKKDQNNK